MINDISFRAYYYEPRTTSDSEGGQTAAQRLLAECHDRAAQRSKLPHTNGAERHKLKRRLRKAKR
jgi:hypothetical protein